MKTPLGLATAMAFTLLSGVGPVAAQDLDGMPSFKDVLSMQAVGGVAISPDGSMVAYTVRSTDWDKNGFDTEIWLAPAQGKPFQLTRTVEGSSGAPRWSPDGRWLAFTANRGGGGQVHLISPLGGEAFAVTEIEGGVRGFQWSPGGDRLMLLVAEPEADEAKKRTELYGAFAFDGETGPDAHLWIMDVAADGTGSEPERLTEGDFHVGSFEWSPDGTRVAYVSQPDASLLSFQHTDIHVLDVASGESTPLVTGPGSDGSPVWSPDGRSMTRTSILRSTSTTSSPGSRHPGVISRF